MLFMDGDRHAQTRKALQPGFDAATKSIEEVARAQARSLVAALAVGGFDLVDQYAKSDGAIDEMLRCEPPLAMIDRRVLADDCDLAGIKLPKGTKIQLVYASANRDIDDADFGDPEVFTVDRKRLFAGRRHPAFGVDAHYCIGAELARTLGRIAFEELLHQFPRLRLDEAFEKPVGDWLPDISFRSLTYLRVRAD